MSNCYVGKLQYDAVTQWATGAKSLNAYCRPTTTYIGAQTAANQPLYERVYKVTTAGTSGGSEPAWTSNPADGATISDGTVTWTNVTGREAEQVTNNWKAPYRCIIEAQKRLPRTRNDYIFVASDHDYTSPSAVGAITYDNGIDPICASVNVVTSAIPPARSTWLAGATERTTLTDAITISSGAWYGFRWVRGSGTSFGNITVGGNQVPTYLDTCNLEFGSTSSSSTFNLGTTSTLGHVELVNTQLKFAATNQTIFFGGTEVIIRDCPASRPLLEAGSSVPNTTSLFAGNLAATNIVMRNLDLTGFVSPVQIPAGAQWSNVLFENCKLPASTAQNSNITGLAGSGGTIGSDGSAGNNKNKLYYLNIGGLYTQDYELARSGGANDGVGKWSCRFLATNSASYSQAMSMPSRAPSVIKRITGTSAIACTIYGISFDTTMPNKREIALALQYISDASSPLGATATSFDLNDTTTLTADTSDWTVGTIGSRANSTGYTVNGGPNSMPQYFKVSSNSGRVFFCTVSGTSNASLPAGYATAVDGGTVTDGGATFRAGWRWKITVNLTPGQASALRATLMNRQTQAETIAFYFDPKLEVV